MAGTRDSGRKTNEVRMRAAALVEEGKILEEVQRLARFAQKDADKIAAMKLLLAYAYGQPTQPLEVGAGDGTDVTFTLRTSPA